MALLEEVKSLPWAAVYNYYCAKNGVTAGEAYISEIQQYEKDTTSKRV